jgi:NACHT-associated inactive Restriction Endonuclease 2
VDYLRVTIKQDSVVLEYPVGVSEHGIDAQGLERFLTVHRRYRETDPGVVSWLVYGGEPASPDLIQHAGAQRIRLVSFVEYQGLLDFRTYVREQTRRLERDPLYVPEFYVPQRLRY